MAYVSNMDDEEQANPSQGPVAPGGTSQTVRLSPSSGVGSANSSPTPGTPSSQGSGGQFATLNQYVNANQGQAEPLAGKITPGINQQYNNLDAQNNAAISSINNQVANAPGYTASNPDVLAQEAANPVSFSGDQGNVKQFQNLLTNTYGGPTSAESTSDYTNQQNAINNAIATGTNNTTTESGRENLLSQTEATPTAGVTALNSAILSQDPNALSSIENAYKPFNNLLTNLSTGAQGVDTTIGKEQADAASSSSAANQAIANQINALNTGVSGELSTAQQNATAQNTQLKNDLAAGILSAADLSALGMTSDQWNTLSAADKAAATSQAVTSANGQWGANTGTTNIDLSNFLTAQDPNVALNAGNVATANDYAKAQAFQTLLNGLNLQAPTTLINPTNASQAGTAPTNLTTYGYKNALDAAQNATSQEQAAAQAYVASLEAGADEEHAQAAAAASAKQFGAASAILPGIAGSFPTTVKTTENLISNPSLKNLGSSISNVFDQENASAKAGLNTVVNTVKNIFCFHPDTQIEMANGSTKAIHKIQIGDDTRGGKVLATTRGVGQGFYWYSGILVTGKHAVKENGVWVRVENSNVGQPFKYFTEVVCNLVTDKHRIWASGIEFADEHETDNYENLGLDASLEALNSNV